MERSKLLELIAEINKERADLMGGKSNDYANEDALANFKRMSQMCKLLGIDPARSPGDAAMFLALLKIDRIMNLKKKGAEPSNESVQDSIKDLHNYIDLFYACELDSNPPEQTGVRMYVACNCYGGFVSAVWNEELSEYVCTKCGGVVRT